MGDIIRRLPLYYRTLRHLRPVQIRYRAWYRLREVIRGVVGHSHATYMRRMGHPLTLAETLHKPVSHENGRFTFLNRSHNFGEEIDWDLPDYGRLWTYNLNYFDFLNQPGMGRKEGMAFIKDFIDKRALLETGLEPYPTSLRGINWIIFLSRHRVEELHVDGCLYAQYRVLLDNLEYHILGNHLLENGCSLLFAAVYFAEEEYWEPAKRILGEQLEEQVLDDGGHFERSPMYHAVVLERLLDCYNLLAHNEGFGGQEELKEVIAETAERMGGWLQAMRWQPRQGPRQQSGLPELNDHYPEGTPDPGALLEYMDRLGLRPRRLVPRESGYRKFRGARYEALVDAGALGPDYLPGHGHSDMLALWLNIDGKEVLCDTGTSTYEAGPLRQAERSAAAHNTVTVEGEEPNETWAAFRVGRRAHPRVLRESDGELTTSHDGYRHVGVEHERTFRFGEHRITLWDRLRGGDGRRKGTFRLHFPPGHNVRRRDGLLEGEGWVIRFEGPLSVTMKEYEKAVGYNRREAAPVAEVAFEGRLKTVIEIGNRGHKAGSEIGSETSNETGEGG